MEFAFIPDEASWNKEVRPWMEKDPEWEKVYHPYPAAQHGRTIKISNGDGAIRVGVTVAGDNIDPVSTLVHEAVHVWQETAEYAGNVDDRETEAYHIEEIFNVLFDQYIKARDQREKSSNTVD